MSNAAREKPNKWIYALEILLIEIFQKFAYIRINNVAKKCDVTKKKLSKQLRHIQKNHITTLKWNRKYINFNSATFFNINVATVYLITGTECCLKYKVWFISTFFGGDFPHLKYFWFWFGIKKYKKVYAV